MDIQPVKKASTIRVTIDSLALGGKGVAKFQDFTVFVDRGVPGQTVDAFIYKKKKRFAEARIANIIHQPPDILEPPCPHFGMCGGCLHQQISYEQQLGHKHRQVIETLQHIGGFRNLDVSPTLPSPDVYHYRNKMEFSFSRQRWLTPDEIQSGNPIDRKDFGFGLHVPGRHDKVLDLQLCMLQSDTANAIYRTVKQWALNSNILPYSTVDHRGYWRFLVIREGKNTGQLMVNIITSDETEHQSTYALRDELLHNYPDITTIVHNINRKKAQIAFGDEEHILHGPGYIVERLDDLQFRISANSFFQTNTRQGERLYNIVKDWAAIQTLETVYDLYCGTGSIALYVARQAKQVIGIELVPQAIQDAKRNCDLNNIKNCHFIEGDLKDQLRDPAALADQFGRPEVIIIDPPRSGMHPSLPARICELAPGRIVYVSCNPATLARDLQLLCAEHYALQRIQPVDMFPHTPHCEVVAYLELKSN
ncbi:23S rRNA (uracil(1939)-C(5))-methyltransferase RlmD [candidate division KSB1 bacterium]|nr:23S rRNA (uracil(1939)-C(5))-methyltransferase RlmD [candidate division KSB1 bacterium]